MSNWQYNALKAVFSDEKTAFLMQKAKLTKTYKTDKMVNEVAKNANVLF